jgi:dipeptidyl aminopeptidase/acylaminoacyl peptidase
MIVAAATQGGGSGMGLAGRCAAVALMLAAAPVAAAPIEAYGHLPSTDNLEISSDGASIALIASSPNDRQLQIRNTGDLALRSALRIGDVKVVSLQWAGPNHLVIVTASTGTPVGLTGSAGERWVASILDVRTGKAINPLDTGTDQDPMINRNAAKPRMNSISDWPQSEIIDDKPEVFLPGTSFAEENGAMTLYRAAPEGGAQPAVVYTGTVDTTGILVDATGKPVAQTDYNRESGAWSLWTRGSGGLTRVMHEVDPIDPPELTGLGRSKTSVIIAKTENDTGHYYDIALNGGSSSPMTILDGTDLLLDPGSRTVLGGVTEQDMTARHVFLDPADQKIWDSVVRAFPGETVWLSSWTDDRSKMVLKVEGPKSGAAYYLLDRNAHSASFLFDEYEGITPATINEVRAISYPAADGTVIQAYLTLPRGVSAKNLPLVVLPHGGPEAHDDPGFDWWSQAIASLGYAVLQPQYRGSAEVSPGFVAAGYGQWGRKMQTDLSDGVRYLAQNGTVDAGKVCIVGASYGGYAAMAGVTLQSGIYRCAVAVAGISDLRRHLSDVAIARFNNHDDVRRYYLRFLGAKDKSDPVLDEISPAAHADKLSAPLLLIHGSIDTVVQPVQSKIMQQAAAKAGKTVQLVTLAGEDHNLARGATRLQMLQAMADFLKANLPPATPSQTATK